MFPLSLPFIKSTFSMVKTVWQNQSKSPQKYTRTQNRAQVKILYIVRYNKQ